MPYAIASSGLVDITATALFVALAVQYTKFLLNYLVSPTSPQQNSWVRLYVYAVSLIAVFAITAGSQHLHTAQDALNAAGAAFAVGTAAIASYHAIIGLDTASTPSTLLPISGYASTLQTPPAPPSP